MARWFNIGGPCIEADNYMLSAMDRLPEVASLVRKSQYFVVHAPRQSGKTTAFLLFANETNAKGEAVAMYCSLETVQEFPKAADGIPKICACLREAAWGLPGIDKFAEEHWPITDMPKDEVIVSGVQNVLRRYAEIAGKPLYVLFDEVDCLGGETLITFLRQLRNGKIDMGKGVPFALFSTWAFSRWTERCSSRRIRCMRRSSAAISRGVRSRRWACWCPRRPG